MGSVGETRYYTEWYLSSKAEYDSGLCMLKYYDLTKFTFVHKNWYEKRIYGKIMMVVILYILFQSGYSLEHVYIIQMCLNSLK